METKAGKIDSEKERKTSKDMKMQKKLKISDLYTAILLLTLFTVYRYGISRIYGMSEYPDEFGYWSSAAGILGWDWSQMASRGSYYSFGYSLILLPFLKFCEDSITAYRMAVGVNFLLQACSLFLLKGIYKHIFTKQVEGEEMFPIGLAMLYPAWSFYSQTTLADSLLIFMVILIGYLWVRFTCVPNFGWGMALVAAVIYNYSLHMRSAGILIAVVVALLLWAWKNTSYGKKVFFLLLAVVILLLVLTGFKEMVQEHVYAYAGAKRLNTNDYGGQWQKVLFLFSREGIKQAFTVVMGKILYLGIAGLGFVFVAVTGAMESLSKWRKKKERATEKNPDVKAWFFTFLLLIIFGQLAVCVIYTIHSADADWLIYGRYMEAIVPLSIFVGASFILRKNVTIRNGMFLGGLYTLAALVCISKVWEGGTGYIRGEHSVATIFLQGDGEVFQVCFFIKVWLVGMLAMTAGYLAVKGFQNPKMSKAIFVGMCMVLGVWTVSCGQIYIYKANENMAKEQILVNVLEEQAGEGKEIFYLEEEKQDWICYVQMQLREKTLNVITIEDLENRSPSETAVVADGDSEYLEYLEENYNRKIAGLFHYVFYKK